MVISTNFMETIYGDYIYYSYTFVDHHILYTYKFLKKYVIFPM